MGPTNLDGDEQGDLGSTAGLTRRRSPTPPSTPEAWRAIEPELGEPGAFGENLHVSGLTEADVCIGDRWAVGTALFEVSQPRQPCWKVEHRWGRDGLVARMEETGRTGWYLRVVTPGVVAAGRHLDPRGQTEPPLERRHGERRHAPPATISTPPHPWRRSTLSPRRGTGRSRSGPNGSRTASPTTWT